MRRMCVAKHSIENTILQGEIWMDFVMENSDLAILQAAKCFMLSDAVLPIQFLLCGDLTF